MSNRGIRNEQLRLDSRGHQGCHMATNEWYIVTFITHNNHSTRSHQVRTHIIRPSVYLVERKRTPTGLCAHTTYQVTHTRYSSSTRYCDLTSLLHHAIPWTRYLSPSRPWCLPHYVWQPAVSPFFATHDTAMILPSVVRRTGYKYALVYQIQDRESSELALFLPQIGVPAKVKTRGKAAPQVSQQPDEISGCWTAVFLCTSLQNLLSARTHIPEPSHEGSRVDMWLLLRPWLQALP